MAEFVLGLTKTAVEGTLSRVKSAIDEEEKLKVRVKNDLVFITGEFQMMQSFLAVANKERAKNEVVRTWVRQIRDLSYDVEDCVEFVIHLDNRSDWSWLWRLLPSFMAPPRHLDEAVAEIKQLRARVEDVSHRNTRYNLLGDSGGSGTGTNYSPNSEPATVPEPIPHADTFHILREVWEAAGKHRGPGDLKKMINSEGSDLEVISLWGSPGPASASDLGVTNLIGEAYIDRETCQKFKSRAWVKLTHPFNPDEFLKSLLTQFYACSHRANVLDFEFREKMRAAVAREDHLMKAQLMKQVSDEQRYLVIVEQLSTVAECDIIRKYLHDSKNGSRIVVVTQQLGLALSCTGEPYQVAELRRCSGGQSLCAFFNKVLGRRTDTGELIWQLRCGGVISVWQSGTPESTIIDKVYSGITHKSKEFEGVEFRRHSWIDVPDEFDLGAFARHLFLNLHSHDLRASDIEAAGVMTDDADVIQGCCKLLREDDCLIIINGVKYQNDWDSIKDNFLSEPTKGCILVITNDKSVARHCGDEANRVFSMEDLESDMLLRRSIKGCEYYGLLGKEASSRGRFFSNREEEARDWMDTFGTVVDRLGSYFDQVPFNQDGVMSFCGMDGDEKVAVARKIYYRVDSRLKKVSWVNVPDPFDLRDFCWRLLLDFHSDDLEAKRTVAMQAQQDPIGGCLMFMKEHSCFIVINGLHCTHDWNLIRDALLFRFMHKRHGILIIAEEKSVQLEDGVVFIDATINNRELKKRGYSHKEMSHAFSSRMIEARDWTKKFELVGHHQAEWDFLLHGLTSATVISVWGIAGVGKSSLLRRFYYPAMIGFFEHIKNGIKDNELYTFLAMEDVTKYGWVDVLHPFNLTDMSRRLILDFLSDDLEAKEIAAVRMIEGQDPVQGCREFMRQEKCFVVIDGLRSQNDWELIRAAFLCEPIASVILVVANEESIAKHCVDYRKEVINVQGLTADKAFDFFRKIAWGRVGLNESELKLSKLTTDKCGGLPRVLAAIGETCSAKDEREREAWLEILNGNFMGKLETSPKFHCLRGLFSWMRSYFEGCPDSLKPCIFYLSVFPLGNVIRRRRLLRRWIAEGYARDTLGSTAEENAEEFFSNLVKLSIISQHERHQQHSQCKECQVNGFFREYIISRPMEDNLVFALEERCIVNSQRTGQHLTISKSWVRDKIVFKSLDLSRLRSLTVFGKWRPFFMSADVNMKFLRVLDLEGTLGVRDGHMKDIGKLLPRLKFLSLRGCNDITHLPSSLGGLRQLQTLDIKGTSIVNLPRAIIMLEKLQYVRARNTQGMSTSSVEVDNSHPMNLVAGIPSPPPTDDEEEEAQTSTLCSSSSSRPSGLVFSWFSKLSTHGLVGNANDGVQFHSTATGGIGKLTALHTLGIINVGGASGKAVLGDLKKLTQLRKLKLSGINRKNWQHFCSTISGLFCLESLSVRLDHDKHQDYLCRLDDIVMPPKMLKTLKLYGGNVHVSVSWMKHLDVLRNIALEHVELTMSTQEEIDYLLYFRFRRSFGRFCIEPRQHAKLYFGFWDPMFMRGFDSTKILKVNCESYKVCIEFGSCVPIYCDYMLVVHCSTTEACLEVVGLENLSRLKEVRLEGTYSEEVERHLKEKVAEHPKKPVLKLEQPPGSSRFITFPADVCH